MLWFIFILLWGNCQAITDYDQLNSQLQQEADITYGKFNTTPLSLEQFWQNFYEDETILENWSYDQGNLERPNLENHLDVPLGNPTFE